MDWIQDVGEWISQNLAAIFVGGIGSVVVVSFLRGLAQAFGKSVGTLAHRAAKWGLRRVYKLRLFVTGLEPTDRTDGGALVRKPVHTGWSEGCTFGTTGSALSGCFVIFVSCRMFGKDLRAPRWLAQWLYPKAKVALVLVDEDECFGWNHWDNPLPGLPRRKVVWSGELELGAIGGLRVKVRPQRPMVEKLFPVWLFLDNQRRAEDFMIVHLPGSDLQGQRELGTGLVDNEGEEGGLVK